MFDTFDRSGNAEFPFNKQVVFRAVCAAVKEIRGMDIENENELASRLDIKSGMSAFSWGEKISISVTGNGANSSVVSVQSGAKTIFGSATTHSKNRENVKKIIQGTSEQLAQNGSDWQSELGLKTEVPITHSSEQAIQSIADEISKFAALRDQGLLSEEEFSKQKARLLGS
jgi:hypothetical protein